MWLRNGKLFLKEEGFIQGDLCIEGCRIVKIVKGQSENALSEDDIDLKGAYVLPGLVDIHFHGCAGHDFCEGTEEAFAAIEHYELTNGITTICPATMTLPEERLASICESAAAYAKKSDCLKGIHLEGPFISEGKKGAQNSVYIQKPNADLLYRLREASGGLTRLVSIAPELPGALECIRACREDFVFSAAHTEADYNAAMEGMEAGITHVTHLFNAMPPFTHRAPGVVGAAVDVQADAELICDGIHIAPAMVRAAFRMFEHDHVVLISDSMMATGMPDGEYELGGQPVKVKGNRAELHDGTIAGSATNLYDCMVCAISMGIPPERAVLAATTNPAASIGLDGICGILDEGREADIVIADDKWKKLAVLKKGKFVVDFTTAM